MSKNTLTIVAKIIAKSAHREEVKKGLLGLITPTLEEKGCINYDLHQDHTNENIFLFYENWESRALWLDHNASSHIAAYQKATDGYIEDFDKEDEANLKAESHFLIEAAFDFYDNEMESLE
jgi:quinol monooxygenase YgiN